MRRELIYAGIVLALMTAALVAGWAVRDLRARDQAAAVQASLEQERAAREGLTVASAEREQALWDRVARLAGERADLARQIEAARRAAPAAEPTRVAELVAEGEVINAPRPDTGSTSGGGGGEPDGPAAPAAPCLLSPGDRLRVRALDVSLRSDAGTDLVVGEAEVWRMAPDEALLFRQAWSAPLSRVSSLPAAAPRPRWGFGGRVEYRGGWAAGPAIAAPPLRLGRVQLEGVADVTAGAGDLAAGATLIVRW